MFRRTRRFMWIVLGLLLPTYAFAFPPDPAHSSIEPILVGDSSGLQILDGFRVTVRDLNNVPLSGVGVVIVFSGPVRPYTSQNAGTGVACPNVKIISDASGNAVFAARFGGFTNANTIDIRGNGTLLSTV